VTTPLDPEHIVVTESVAGSDVPVELMYVEVWDGLYAPIGVRKPAGEGPFPIVLLASGNGGGGMAWVRDAVANRGYIMEALLAAGFACAWLRYRSEVELGYHEGGKLVRDIRQGRDLFGEMVLKITSEYQGVAAAVASEPAAHEFLALTPDDTAFVSEETHLRNIEGMQMSDVDKVRARIDEPVARARIATIDTPILVMGREDDHLQGIFRTSYDLLAEMGKDVEWVSYDHPIHGYVYPVRGADGEYEVDDVQRSAIAAMVGFLSKHF
jgi:hypothetical protein